MPFSRGGVRGPTRRLPRRLAVSAVLAALIASAPLAPTAAAQPNPCRELTVPVSTAVTTSPADGVDSYTIHGRLCLPKQPARTVLLALHGFTYSSTYWDPGLQPDTYSFTRAMTGAGYAVFAIDRLGYGRSSHPNSSQVTLDAQAAVVHEIVTALRTGQIGGVAFPRVVLVGHSYGTDVAMRETALHNDADAVLGTAWSSTPAAIPLARAATVFYPASWDAKFADQNLDLGYVTTRPDVRNQDVLYYAENADPEMIRHDQEVLRDTATSGEGTSVYYRSGALALFATGPDQDVEVPLSGHTRSITVPTFILNGDRDPQFCGFGLRHCQSPEALQRNETRFFDAQACLRAGIVPNSGHNLTLHRNAPAFFAAAREWLDAVVGPDGSQLAAYRAGCAPFQTR